MRTPRFRTLCSLAALLWMGLALCPDLLARNDWREVAVIAGVARRHCDRWHWQAVLAVLLCWHLAAGWRGGGGD